MNDLSIWARNEPLSNLLQQHFAMSSTASDTPSFKSIFQHIFGTSASGTKISRTATTATATTEAATATKSSSASSASASSSTSTSTSTLPILTQEILQLTWLGKIVARATRLTCMYPPTYLVTLYSLCPHRPTSLPSINMYPPTHLVTLYSYALLRLFCYSYTSIHFNDT